MDYVTQLNVSAGVQSKYSLTFRWSVIIPITLHSLASAHLGYASCWVVATESSSSCRRPVTRPASKPCCPRRRWRWSRWRSTSETRRACGTCWEPPSSCPRPPSSPRRWKPARWENGIPAERTGFQHSGWDFSRVNGISSEWTGFQKSEWDLSTVEGIFTRIKNSTSILNNLLLIGW